MLFDSFPEGENGFAVFSIVLLLMILLYFNLRIKKGKSKSRWSLQSMKKAKNICGLIHHLIPVNGDDGGCEMYE